MSHTFSILIGVQFVFCLWLRLSYSLFFYNTTTVLGTLPAMLKINYLTTPIAYRYIHII